MNPLDKEVSESTKLKKEDTPNGDVQHYHNWKLVGSGPWLHCRGCDRWKHSINNPTKEN